jgi:hypothetical protein
VTPCAAVSCCCRRWPLIFPLSHASPVVHSCAQASSRTLRTGHHDDEEALLPLLCGGCSGQGMLLLSCEARGGGDVGAGHGQEGGGGWGGWWWVASRESTTTIISFALDFKFSILPTSLARSSASFHASDRSCLLQLLNIAAYGRGSIEEGASSSTHRARCSGQYIS